MSAAEDQALVRRELDEMWNAGNLDVVHETSHDQRTEHAATHGRMHGVDRHKQMTAATRAAFPDSTLTIDYMLTDGDMTAAHWTLRGTQQGEFMGVPATGRAVIVTGINVHRIVDGKIVESWTEWNRLGLLQQLGAQLTPDGAG